MEGEQKCNFNRYTPQHPLPPEIQKMSHDETVCQYCGVSYLIHNEIKALEKRVKEMESCVEEHSHCGDKLKQHQEQVKYLTQKVAELDGALTSERLLISQLQSQLKKTSAENKLLQDQLNILNKQLNVAEADLDSARRRLLPIGPLSQNLMEMVSRMRSEIGSLRETTDIALQQSKQELSKLSDTVSSVMEVACREQRSLESSLQCVEMEKVMANQTASQLSEKVKALSKCEEQLIVIDKSHSMLQKKCHSLEENIAEVNKQLQEATNANLKKDLELQQCYERLNQKCAELDQKKIDSENSLSGLQESILNKDQELLALQTKLKSQELKHKEVGLQNAVSLGELKQLRENLDRAKLEIQSLQQERESMITVHQNRIEQLRESFRNKMEEADSWQIKLKETVAKENARHASEMKSLEDGLKANFILELKIEKDKYDELVKKYQFEHNESELKFRNQQLASVSGVQKDFENRLASFQKQAKENETTLHNEITTLKAIIADLEDRLGKVNLESADKISDLHLRLGKAEEELEQTRAAIIQLKSSLTAANQEISFLQDTVHKECEERFNLTEALNCARQDLLLLKSSGGSLQPLANVRRSNSLTSEKHTSSASSPLSPPESNTADFQSSASRKLISPSSANSSASVSISLGFQGQPAKQVGKMRGTDIDANRRRIAALLGKRS